MKIISKANYFILELNRSSKLDELLDFLSQVSSNYPNVIIDFISSTIDNDIIVNKLFPFHLNWEKRNKSFILVSNIGKDSLKSMISLKTREEALDFFHMEELTRNI